MEPDASLLNQQELEEEALARFGSLFDTHKRHALVRMIDTQVNRMVCGDMLGYPRIEIDPEERATETLRCREMVSGVTLMGLTESRPDRNKQLYTRIMLALGRTWRLKTQYPSYETNHLWRQAYGLIYAHYQVEVPLMPSERDEESEVLSLEASSDDQWAQDEGMEITIINPAPKRNVSNSRDLTNPQTSRPSMSGETPTDQSVTEEVELSGNQPSGVKPNAPGPRSFTGRECNNCYTLGHWRVDCQYRRYRPTTIEFRTMRAAVQTAGTTSEGRGGAEQGMPLILGDAVRPPSGKKMKRD